jgi:uncharacterized protein involved in type VI secretion and phage assembly
LTGTSVTFYGKYRGIVTDNMDPLMMGRIRAKVPDVMGDQESGWAMPCAPFSGKTMGFFALPDKDAGVWIEFEHGDPDYPIWSGCWWGSLAEMPSAVIVPPPASSKVMIMTKGGSSILIDDTPGIGGVTIETSTGQKIVLGVMSVEISNGQGASIKMTGPRVSINDGALEVI